MKGVTYPKGFKACGVCAGFRTRPDFALVVSDKICNAAGVFTTNAFKAAPVLSCMEKIQKHKKAQAIVINSGTANACTGTQGDKDVISTCEYASEFLNIHPDYILTGSTGVIGRLLDMEKMYHGVDLGIEALSYEGGELASRAIMTTDTVNKTYEKSLTIEGKEVRLGGMCKGAGMICPNMATTLCFITTDAKISGELLQKALSDNIELSFNSLTVDGDMSTNDTALCLANGMSDAEIKENTESYKLFNDALCEILQSLAKQMAADGEGATKYVEIKVKGARNYKEAKSAAKTVANSALVKTAIFGTDPNWGRVLCAAGRSEAYVDPKKCDLWFGDVKIVEKGEPLNVSPEEARKPMLEKELFITIDLGLGDGEATIFTCDFSYKYVEINAEYTT